jgi:ubiquinone/menaquinone biosynthesis C-methylase UbiE
MKWHKGIRMEGFIASSYDKNARKYQRRVYNIYIDWILKYLKAGDKILEVAPGPGYLAIDLSKKGNFDITGLEISNTFVNIARKNAKEEGANVRFDLGDVHQMPYEDKTFDFIICTAAFKNFSDPVKALNEMHRVLKPKGIAWIEDLRHDFTKAELDSFTKNVMKLKGFSGWFIKWSLGSYLKKRAYTRSQFADFISKSKFKSFEIIEHPVEFEVVLKK